MNDTFGTQKKQPTVSKLRVNVKTLPVVFTFVEPVFLGHSHCFLVPFHLRYNMASRLINPRAIFKTSLGSFSAELFHSKVPLTTANFIDLASSVHLHLCFEKFSNFIALTLHISRILCVVYLWLQYVALILLGVLQWLNLSPCHSFLYDSIWLSSQ